MEKRGIDVGLGGADCSDFNHWLRCGPMSWLHFKREEFECRCGCGGNLIADDFVDALDVLREQLGFALVISSGYRCPQHNMNVSSTGHEGPHTTGRAADIKIARPQAFELARMAMRSDLFTGIGFMQRGIMAKRFIHLDDLPNKIGSPRPRVWTY